MDICPSPHCRFGEVMDPNHLYFVSIHHNTTDRVRSPWSLSPTRTGGRNLYPPPREKRIQDRNTGRYTQGNTVAILFCFYIRSPSGNTVSERRDTFPNTFFRSHPFSKKQWHHRGAPFSRKDFDSINTTEEDTQCSSLFFDERV